MASTLSSLFKDQNLNVHSTGTSALGKGDAVRTQRKGGLGGRKPLGDLSNSGKPSLTQALTKKPSKEVIHDVASSKKGFAKASEKAQTRNRPALSDISNSQKPQVQKKNNTKLSVVAEKVKPFCPNDIVEEGFLHNHAECIRAQKNANAMDMDYFLMTLGLHTSSKKLAPPPEEPPLSSKFEPESPPRYFELEELPERQYPWMSEKFDSPPPCRSPEAPNFRTCSPLTWEDCNFQLTKTP